MILGSNVIITDCHFFQPIILQKVRKARTSSAASSISSQKRVRIIMKTRSIISGGDSISVDQQQSLELKSRSRSSRQAICAAAGVRQRLKATRRCSLAMKSHLGLTWGQLRKQKRFLKQLGVEFESERKERETRKEALGDHLRGKLAPFIAKDDSAPSSVGGFVNITAPFVYIESLPNFLHEILDKYQSNNKLVWHDGVIPEDEIWVKIGGDHGGDSFKLSLQVINLQEPNAKENTIVFAIARAKDYYHNLAKILQRFNAQIQKIPNMKWQDKAVKVFLFGDYDFLRKVVGISGHRGTYPCIWCLITRESMCIKRDERGVMRRRKLSQLKADHRAFVHDGKQKKNQGGQLPQRY